MSLGERGDGHFSRTPIARRLQQPTRESIASRTGSRPPQRTAPCLALLRVGFTEPAESPRLLVRSYRTFSPLPDPPPGAEHPRAAIGGVFSVALSLASRPVGVTDHPVLRSPDFPPATGRLAAASASGRPVHFETKIIGSTSPALQQRAGFFPPDACEQTIIHGAPALTPSRPTPSLYSNRAASIGANRQGLPAKLT